MRFLNASICASGAREITTSVTSRAFKCGTLPSKWSASSEQLWQPSAQSGPNIKWYTINWLRPSNRSASVSFPFGPSNTYFFSTRSHGNSRRWRLTSSRSRVNSFSLVNSALRAASHCAGDVTFEFSLLFVTDVAIVIFPFLVVFESKLFRVISRPKTSHHPRRQCSRRRNSRGHRRNTHQAHWTHCCSPPTRL